MKIKNILLAGIVLLGAVSCIRDDSEMGTTPLSYIELDGEDLPENHTVDLPNVLTINAPKVKQKGVQKPLSYEWLLEGKVIGTEAALHYQSGKLGTLQGRLKIYNEDCAFFRKFFITTQTVYTTGVVLLSKFNNQSLLSFMRTDKANEKPVKDAYSAINPTFPLGTTPYCVAYATGNFSSKMIYVFTDPSGNSAKLDNNTLEVSKLIESPTTPLKTFIYNKNMSSQYAVVGGDKFWDFDYSAHYLVGMTQSQYLDPNSVKVADCAICITDWAKYQAGFVFWDKTAGELWITSSYSAQPYTLSSRKYHGYSIVAMMASDNLQKFNFIVKSPDNSTLSLVRYTPTVKSPYQGGPSGDMERGTFSESVITESGIDKAEVIVGMTTVPRIYYAKANKIYSMSTESGLFSTEPVYTLGTDGDKIVSMIFNTTEDRLYVGVNSPSGEYRGSLYCINITSTAGSEPIVWDQKAMAGEIVSMCYKPQ